MAPYSWYKWHDSSSPFIAANFKNRAAQFSLADLAEIFYLPGEFAIQVLWPVTCTLHASAWFNMGLKQNSAICRTPKCPKGESRKLPAAFEGGKRVHTSPPLSSSKKDEEGPAQSSGDCLFLSSSDSGVSGVGVSDPSAVGGVLSLLP